MKQVFSKGVGGFIPCLCALKVKKKDRFLKDFLKAEKKELHVQSLAGYLVSSL